MDWVLLVIDQLTDCELRELRRPEENEAFHFHNVVQGEPVLKERRMSPREIIISSDNVLNKSITFRKGNDAATEELVETLKSCLENQKETVGSYANEKVFEVAEEKTSVPNEDRLEQKITVKIFLYSLQRDDINAAIRRGLENTSGDYLDTLVISFSGQSEATRLTLDMLKSAWSALEESVNTGKAKMIGLCDVDTQLFIQLYSWATVKPSIVQINLASCCVVPPELAEFCKQQSIQLLTHSDPINILPDEKLEELMKNFDSGSSVAGQMQKSTWEAKWVLRYLIHLKARGVLSNKGYVAAFGSA